MTITTVAVGELGTNCYIASNTAGDAAVIDPGADAARIREALDRAGLTLRAVLLTHAHFDHIGAVDALIDGQDIPVYCHKDDIPALTDGAVNLSAWFDAPSGVRAAATAITEGDTVTVADMVFTVLHTPGHTVGSVCYQHGDILFAGDTLFCESVGRTDFPGGDTATLLASLRRLLALAPTTTVYPGHDAATTVAHERQYNPYVRYIKGELL